MPKPEMAGFLKEIPTFARLGAERLNALAAHTQVQEFSAGDVINSGSDWLDLIWVPVQGLVRVADHAAKGEPVTVFAAARGDLIGCFDAQCKREHELTCISVVDSLVAVIAREHLLSHIRADPDFSAGLIRMLNERLWEARELRMSVSLPAEQRLARTLLLLVGKLGHELPLTRRMLADLSGVARETAIRALSPLERAGLIRSARGRIEILSPEKLEKLAKA